MVVWAVSLRWRGRTGGATTPPRVTGRRVGSGAGGVGWGGSGLDSTRLTTQVGSARLVSSRLVDCWKAVTTQPVINICLVLLLFQMSFSSMNLGVTNFRAKNIITKDKYYFQGRHYSRVLLCEGAFTNNHRESWPVCATPFLLPSSGFTPM